MVALGRECVKVGGVVQRTAITSLLAAQAWAIKPPGRAAAKRKNLTL